MAKLTEAQKKQIQIEYATGASKSELARKFGVSDVAIAKLLKKNKSSNSNQSEPKRSNRESAQEIVSKAYEALLDRDYSKVHPETLLKIIGRITDIYGAEALEAERTEEVTEIVVEIEDASEDEAED